MNAQTRLLTVRRGAGSTSSDYCPRPSYYHLTPLKNQHPSDLRPLSHHGTLAARAWQLRHSLTFYDALYLALAESLNCPLITADKRIERAHPDHELIQTIPAN